MLHSLETRVRPRVGSSARLATIPVSLLKLKPHSPSFHHTCRWPFSLLDDANTTSTRLRPHFPLLPRFSSDLYVAIDAIIFKCLYLTASRRNIGPVPWSPLLNLPHHVLGMRLRWPSFLPLTHSRAHPPKSLWWSFLLPMAGSEQYVARTTTDLTFQSYTQWPSFPAFSSSSAPALQATSCTWGQSVSSSHLSLQRWPSSLPETTQDYQVCATSTIPWHCSHSMSIAPISSSLP